MSVDGFDGVVDVDDVLEREEKVIHFSFVAREPFIQRFFGAVLKCPAHGCIGDSLSYNLCFATATQSMTRRIVPLRISMWSTKEEGFTSENDKVLEVIKAVSDALDRRGIYVYWTWNA